MASDLQQARPAVAPAAVAPRPQEALGLRPGDRVRVRTAAEILSTLDADGALDRLPFMPEMLQYCGRVLPVSRRAHKTCTPGGLGLRRMENTVHLGDLRCDGGAHGGCQAGCLLFWKEAWLERAGPDAPPGDPDSGEQDSDDPGTGDPAAGSLRDLVSRATATEPASADGERIWRCQATEVPRATVPLSGWQLGQWAEDAENWGWWKVLRFFALEAFNRLQTLTRRHLPARWLIHGGQRYPFIAGPLAKGQTPAATLELAPGDLVRVKSREEIERTLDGDNKNRGISFDTEMVRYCGRTARVQARVRQLIDEDTGRMIHIKRDCIILEGVTCTADYHRLCPRGIYPYWREIWLERVT